MGYISMTKRSRTLGRKRTFHLVRILIILSVCFVGTIFVLQLELERQNEEETKNCLPAFAYQSSAGIAGVIEDLTERLTTAAAVIAGGDLPDDSNAQSVLQAMEGSVYFAEMGVCLPDGSLFKSDGSRETSHSLHIPNIQQVKVAPYYLSPAETMSIDGRERWVSRVFVEIPGSDALLYGAVDFEEIFNTAFFPWLKGSARSLILFETGTGVILLDTLHSTGSVGENFYETNLLSKKQVAQLQTDNANVTDTGEQMTLEGRNYYFSGINSEVPGWSLCVGVRELPLNQGLSAGLSSPLPYLLLACLYTLATGAILLYQHHGETNIRNKMRQAIARSNALLNVAVPGSNMEIFEHLTNGKIRLLSPELDGGQRLKETLGTPKNLLSYLNCSAQWEPAFLQILEQAACGQGGEIELQTLDERETWIQLRIEPLLGNEEASAIGTVRNITDVVRERRRQKSTEKFIGRMMEGTLLGVEVSLEEAHWRILWGWQKGERVLAENQETLSYDHFLESYIIPHIHPMDKKRYLETMNRTALLRAFFEGETCFVQEYRGEVESEHGHEWYSCEMQFFREPNTKKIMCNFFLREESEAKWKELEERRQLEEKQRVLLDEARKLVESEDELDFVHVIADYYQGIYVVNLNDDQTRTIKVPPYFAEILRQEDQHLSSTLIRYCEEQLHEEYVPAFREVTNYNNLRNGLSEGHQVDITFQKLDGTWIEMRVFAMPGYSAENPKTLWVFEDNTETVNLQKEEEKARLTARTAEAASEAKSQFLANMSHDIRTPLNAILGMSELGLREESAEGKTNCFQDIRASGRILLENINSILDLSKIEAGKMEITPESYNILSVLHDTITVLRMRAQEKKLAFIAEVDEYIPATLWGDDVSISHIIMNLGGNAIKYTNVGSVTMRVNWEPAEVGGTLVIHLLDTGIGIREENLPHIFHSYGRLEYKANRHIEGTGLGLSICQNLTKLMDGTMGVQSIYGEGSDFWVRLPQGVIDPTPCGTYQERTSETAETAVSNSIIAPEAVILVVDDQPLNLKVCEGLLRPYEAEVYTARSGEEALRQMSQVWPDLVFMDHMMPDMDGVETTARIREMGKKDPYFAVLPIIALTANAMKGMREYFLENGFSDFISKPVELDRLDAVLQDWIPEDKQKAPSLPSGIPSAEPPPPDLADLPGVEVEHGMGYCGNAQIYRKTLILFREQIEGRRTRIEAAYREENREDYVIEVHSLKSEARWIGAMVLGDQAERLEKAGRASDWQTIRLETADLLATYAELGKALENIKEGKEG